MTVLNDLDHTCGISDEKLTELFKESIRIDDEIRKIKGEILKRERKINSLCYHDIIINDYCFICDSMCSNKDEYGKV